MSDKQITTLSNQLEKYYQDVEEEFEIVFNELGELFQYENNPNFIQKIFLWLYNSKLSLILLTLFFTVVPSYLLVKFYDFTNDLTRNAFAGFLIVGSGLVFFLLIKIFNYICNYQYFQQKLSQEEIEQIKEELVIEIKKYNHRLKELKTLKNIKYKYIEEFVKSFFEEKQSRVKRFHTHLLVLAILAWATIFALLSLIKIFSLPIDLTKEDFYYKTIPLLITGVGFIWLVLKSFFEILISENESIYHRFLRFLKQKQIVEKAE